MFTRSFLRRSLVAGLFASFLAVPSISFATKSYQVTGPVTEVTDTKIVVTKGKEKFEIARNPTTKVSGGELKVGDRVTVYYDMTANDIEVKADKKTK